MILMNASFMVFACALIQIVRSSFYSLIQNNISSSCNFIMSNDAVWLVERCSNASFIYKSNGTAIKKLSLSIPFTSDCQLSVNSGGNFLFQVYPTYFQVHLP
jgi:hypothetical protein